MKRYNYYTYWMLFLLLFLGTACEDYLSETQPTDVVNAERALVSIEDYETALNAAYANLVSYYTGDIQSIGGFPADEVKRGVGNNGAGVFLLNHEYVSTEAAFTTMWLSCYSAIDQANLVISTIDGLADGTAAERNSLKGQALAIRALVHFDLVRTFAQPYTTTTDASHEGIPIVVANLDPDATPSRNTVAEVYAQIFADLNEASGLLSGNDSGNAPNRFSNNAVNALLARAYLYTQNYANAISSASAVIANVPLETTTQFASVWSGSAAAVTNEGMVLRLGVVAGDDELGDTWYLSDLSGGSRIAPSQDLTGLFTAADVRSIDSGVYFADVSGLEVVVNKYNGDASNPGLAPIPVLRSAEMYLIRAEAYARSGDDANALVDYNTLRSNRIVGYVNESLSGSALLTAIANERFRELCFEGHRFYDLRRTGSDVVRNDTNSTSPGLAAGNFRFTGPIPQDEIFANDNMTQNPGY